MAEREQIRALCSHPGQSHGLLLKNRSSVGPAYNTILSPGIGAILPLPSIIMCLFSSEIVRRTVAR